MVLLQAQAYLGVFYMRGLQGQEKRGLKYLVLAANSGVSNPCARDPRFGICRWRISGFLGNGSVRILVHAVKGQSGALVPLGEEPGPGHRPCWAGGVPTAPGPASSFQNCAGFPLWSIYTLFSQNLSLLQHLENLVVSVSNLFFKIGPLFLSFYREDENNISGFIFLIQAPLTYLNT